jgi:hypothetical protein
MGGALGDGHDAEVVLLLLRLVVLSILPVAAGVSLAAFALAAEASVAFSVLAPTWSGATSSSLSAVGAGDSSSFFASPASGNNSSLFSTGVLSLNRLGCFVCVLLLRRASNCSSVLFSSLPLSLSGAGDEVADDVFVSILSVDVLVLPSAASCAGVFAAVVSGFTEGGSASWEIVDAGVGVCAVADAVGELAGIEAALAVVDVTKPDVLRSLAFAAASAPS